MPAQGYINAMLHFANALHFMGFHITFVNTEFNHRRSLEKVVPAGLPKFHFATIPDGVSSPDDEIDKSRDFIALYLSIKRHCVAVTSSLSTYPSSVIASLLSATSLQP
ncbi:hypothetical protein ZIOFF_005227 [Zingiber officinale]|uniref:Uncharacterized protein n=1 Tax=Zingiber officinale TaxID=94328 RepID=A0A8J5IA93_ZINOF|nr:hypothetical protein ZIOFF_005227 [Zingiber officinale]